MDVEYIYMIRIYFSICGEMTNLTNVTMLPNLPVITAHSQKRLNYLVSSYAYSS